MSYVNGCYLLVSYYFGLEDFTSCCNELVIDISILLNVFELRLYYLYLVVLMSLISFNEIVEICKCQSY